MAGRVLAWWLWLCTAGGGWDAWTGGGIGWWAATQKIAARLADATVDTATMGASCFVSRSEPVI